MLLIKCTFDKEIGPSGMDPLGDLLISDGRSEIIITNTYLDSWLAGFVEAISRLKASPHANVQTEEPSPMEINAARDGHLEILYKGRQVAAAGLKEFESALRAAVNSFLDVLSNYPETWQNRDIDPIRKFWSTTPN